MSKFSLSIAHTPWIPERRKCVGEMLTSLLPLSREVPYLIHDKDYRGHAWADIKDLWALECWRWHIKQDVTHCVMMSDDLGLHPRFWDVLGAMVKAAPLDAMGLMSNHPSAPKLLEMGHHWYRASAWLVGPCIVMPRAWLEHFVTWYEAWYPKLPRGKDEYGFQEFFHDDSSLNEWLTQTGRTSLHPIPAPIEHRLTLGRSHDAKPFPKYAAESINWIGLDLPMCDESFWQGAETAPILAIV